MTFKAWREWGLVARLITIALLPACLMFVVVSLALYVVSQREIRADIQDRGRLIATSLAESSRYGVVSGNITYLQHTLARYLDVDASITAIEVLSATREPLASVERQHVVPKDAQIFESPIQVQLLEGAPFDWSAEEPHVSSPAPSAPSGTAKTAGYVRVVMSSAPLLEVMRGRLYLALATVLVATLLSALAGLYLANWLRNPLTAVINALRQIRRGHYDISMPASNGELQELQSTLVEMAAALSARRHVLEEQVATRTQELQHAMMQVMEADAEKRRLIAQSNALIEEERRRIAVEIHDHLNAALIYVRMEAERIATLAKTSDRDPLEEIARIARRLSHTTADLYSLARDIVKRLRPELLDTLGLQRAIEEMVRSYDQADQGCRFACRTTPGFPDLRGERALVCYRVVQEAFSNIVKHAHATEALVSLDHDDVENTVHINITDNGVGFDAASRSPTGIGLIGMRERVAAVDGQLTIASDLGRGTRVTIDLPAEPHPSA